MGKLKEKKEVNFEQQLSRDKNHFMIEKIDEFIKTLSFVIYNDNLYVKNKLGNYVTGNNEINKVISEYIPLTFNQNKEFLYQIKLKAPVVETDACFRLNNGMLKKNSEGFYEVVEDNKEDFCPFNLDLTYDKNADDKWVNKFLNDISSSEEMKETLIELIGSIFLIDKSPCKIFYLFGTTGSNGKSTFTAMLRNFIGESLTSNIDISNLKDDTNMSNLIGKLINISDDADFNILRYDKTSRMKSIASGEILTIRPIYCYPITAKFFCTLVVSCNNLPLFDDKSGGLIRRLVILEFLSKFEKKDKIVNILDLLSTPEAKSTLLNLAIKGMNKIISNNYELSENESIKKTMVDYYLETDNVRKFLVETPNIENQKVSEVYDSYKNFCNDIVQEPVGKNLFGSRLKMYGYISKVRTEQDKGKKISSRIYVKDNSKKHIEL